MTAARKIKEKRPVDLKGVRQLWDFEDLMTYLKIPRSTVRMYIAMEKIPCVRIGRHLRFVPEEIERMVKSLG